MRDDNPHHTPHEDYHPRPHRRIMLNADRNQKHHKSGKKDSVDISTFSEVSEDNPVVEHTESRRKDSIDIFIFPEVSEDNHAPDSTERCCINLSPLDSPSSVHPPTSGITLLSSTDSAATAKLPDLSINRYVCLQSDSEVASSLDTELVVKHLQQLMLHAHNSADTDLRYKKLLESLVERVIEGLYNLPDERHWFTESVSRRSLTVFLSLIFWIVFVSTAFLFSKFAQSSYSGPPPT